MGSTYLESAEGGVSPEPGVAANSSVQDGGS